MKWACTSEVQVPATHLQFSSGGCDVGSCTEEIFNGLLRITHGASGQFHQICNGLRFMSR